MQTVLDVISVIETVYCTQEMRGLTRGMPLRPIHPPPANAPGEPGWMAPFLASLTRDDLAPATLRGYRYDLRHFLAWHRTVQDRPFTLEGLTEYELIAYRQHMVATVSTWSPPVGGPPRSTVGWTPCAACADGRVEPAPWRPTPRMMFDPCGRSATVSRSV